LNIFDAKIGSSCINNTHHTCLKDMNSLNNKIINFRLAIGAWIYLQI